MKKLLSIAASALAFAAIADSYSPNIGVTAITPTQKNTIIPVKFESLAGGAVKAKDLVCVTELPANTELYVFQNNSYTAWYVDEEGEGDVKVKSWQPLEAASTSGPAGAPDAGQTLAASSAVWLIFPEVNNTVSIPETVYIYGQVLSSTKWTIEKGKSNLLCNTKDVAIDGAALNTAIADVLTSKDKIIPVNGSTFDGEYVWNGTMWKKMEADGTITKNAPLPSIPAGGAFWYVSAVTGENAEVTF